MKAGYARLISSLGIALVMLLVAPNAADAYVYWVLSDSTVPSGNVSRANTNGSGVVNNLATSAEGGFIAVYGNYLYYKSSDTTIGRATVDGADANPNFITGLTSDPRGIAVNGSYIYWAQYGHYAWDADRGIFRIGMSGGVAGGAIVANPSGGPNGIALDSNYIYWANSDNAWGGPVAISRAKLDGTSVDDTFIAVADNPVGLAVGANKIFFQYFGGSGSIQVATLNGSGPAGAPAEFLSSAQISNPQGLATDNTYLYYVNQVPIYSIGRVRLDGAGTPEQNFISTGSGNTVPYGLAVDALPTPPAQQQTAANNCVTAPVKIKRNRTYRLMKAKCKTNLGKAITVKGSYRGRPRGDMAYFKIYRNAKGETMLRTSSVRIKLRLTWSSAARGYSAGYLKVKHYTT